ncbi:hypothetical protein HYT74_00345 [Candidatus Daviesbacteria bacterium]|nr:hypothetical protein [Candidatus Daviesbacteria bacterium]
MAKPLKVKNISVPDYVIANLLTPSEIRMLKNRWQIIQYLEKGLSIRKIAEQMKVGTDTVIRVARMLEKSDLLNKNRKKEKQVKTQTPWVFGKNE